MSVAAMRGDAVFMAQLRHCNDTLLGRELAAANVQLREDVGRAGESDRVGHGLFEAIDTWKDAVIRCMEFAVSAQLEAVEAAEKET